jgi:tetratricopeptide (TPR) repeat protein
LGHVVENSQHIGPLEAIEAGFAAVDQAFEAGDFRRVRELVEHLEQLFDDAGVASDRVLCARRDWRKARLAAMSGDPDTALELAQRSLEELDDMEWPAECGHTELIQARILRRMGQLEDAELKCRCAIGRFAISGDEHGLALSRAGLGVVLMRRGEYQPAREAFLEAIEALESMHLIALITEMWSSVARCWLEEGNTTQADECARRAFDLAEEHAFVSHQAMACNTLGEISRVAEDYDRAAQWYARALELFQSTDNLNLHIAQANLALVEVARGHFPAAREGLETAVAKLIDVGLQSRLPSLYCGLMACAASEGDWDAWDAYHAEVRRSIEHTSVVDADLGWASSLASAVAAEHGREDLQVKS